MSELPKIVRQRLAAGQRPGNEHPEADLLAALAEQRLSGAERERVLAHLAACAECREVAALAAPRDEPTQTVVRPVRRRWWLLQPRVLRWGSLAAVVALVAVGASMYLSKGRPGEPKMATYTELSQAARVPAAPAAAEAAKEKVAPPAEATARRAAKPRENPEREKMAANQLKKDVAPPKEATRSAVTGGLASAGRAQESSRDAMAAGAAAEAVTVNPAPAAAPVAKSEVAQNAPPPALDDKLAAAPSKSQPAGAANETVAVQAEAAATPAGVAQPGVARRYAQKSAVAAQARWSVSSDGQVEISRDGGRNWSTVTVAKDVKFLAVSATGGDVWAGGSGGALFHSRDSGQTWARVAVGTDEDITRVDFRDAQHGTVTTAGAQWTTADGGKSWRSQK